MNAIVTDNVTPFDLGHASRLARAAEAFRETRDPGAMYPHAGAVAALDGLLRVANDGNSGCGLLTGAAGLGKSLARAALQRRAAAERCVVVAVESGLLGFDDLLLEVLSQLRGERVSAVELPGRYERMSELKSVLANQVVPFDRHVLLLLDEADHYDMATLEAIGSLQNLASDQRTYVVPVLFGLPSLRPKLGRLTSLRQRIGIGFELQPLGAADCAGYVQQRLRNAGLEGRQLFEPGVSAGLQHCSGGVPRILNALCRNMLLHAAGLHKATAGQESLDAARLLLPDCGNALSAVSLGQ